MIPSSSFSRLYTSFNDFHELKEGVSYSTIDCFMFLGRDLHDIYSTYSMGRPSQVAKSAVVIASSPVLLQGTLREDLRTEKTTHWRFLTYYIVHI